MGVSSLPFPSGFSSPGRRHGSIYHLAQSCRSGPVSKALLFFSQPLTCNSEVNNKFAIAGAAFTGTTSLQLSVLLSQVTNQVFDEFVPEFTHTFSDAQIAIYNIGNSTFNSTEQSNEISTLFRVIQDSIFSTFDIEPPEMPNVVNKDPNEEWSKNMDAFMLVVSYLLRWSPIFLTSSQFVNFFIAAGLTLVMMTTLNAIIRPMRTWGEKARIAVNCAIGVALASLAAVVNTNAGFNFAQSAWVLPTVALSYVLGAFQPTIRFFVVRIY